MVRSESEEDKEKGFGNEMRNTSKKMRQKWEEKNDEEVKRKERMEKMIEKRGKEDGECKGTLVPCDSYPDHMTNTLQQSRL